MKTFKELKKELEEHPNLRTRIVKAINPMDKLRDTMDSLKKLPGKAKYKAIASLQKKMDAVNPLSPINKKITDMRKKKKSKLIDKKQKLTTKVKGIENKLKTLRKQTAK